jgi:hypothetical protein
VTDTLELTAKRIADRGRDALLARLRPAFADAAGAHAEILKLDGEQLEQMVQRAADRADGLQWRRALATVASEELGIGLGEALGHPAVERAQAIVGAPSYEDSLAALEARSDAPVALDRRAKAAPPTDAETRPARFETKPEAAGTRPAPADAKPVAAETKPARADAKPAPAKPSPDQSAAPQPGPVEFEPELPGPRVRRIERAPSQPERTAAPAQQEHQEGAPSVRRIERRPPQPAPENRSAEEKPTGPQPKPASAAAQAGLRPAPTEAGPRPAPTEAGARPAPTEAGARPAPTEAGPRPAPTEAGPRPAPTEAGPRPAPTEAGPRPAPTQAGTPPASTETAPSRPAPSGVGSPARPPDSEGLRVAAIHLGGVTNLRPGESEIELRLSEHGLDIARQSGEIIGRLGWDEIQGLEVPPPRGLLWRRRAPRSHLVVRAGHGDASFEIPSVYPDELSEHLEPVLERYGRRSAMR